MKIHHRQLMAAGLLLCLSNDAAWATDCNDVFPGPQSFSVGGSSSIDGSAQCNGGACGTPPSLTTPVLPSVSPTGDFNLTSLVNGEYVFDEWGLGINSVVTFSGDGTSLVYFTGNVTINTIVRDI